jgi:hypothetical protein
MEMTGLGRGALRMIPCEEMGRMRFLLANLMEAERIADATEIRYVQTETFRVSDRQLASGMVLRQPNETATILDFQGANCASCALRRTLSGSCAA